MKTHHSRRVSRRALRCIFVLFAGLSLPAWVVRADDLDAAYSQLKAGRAYLVGFPSTKTRTNLINDFTGRNGQAPNRPDLVDALGWCIAIRAAEPPDPASYSAGSPPRSLIAREIAWQALEANSTGYLYAGNKDLLDATRIAYPGSNPADDTRELPKEEPKAFGGASQKQSTYARLYFLQAIKDTLGYMAQDSTGRLRATGTTYPTLPHYVTFDDQESLVLAFPRFDDPNFGGPTIVDREGSQSVAYLYGSALERYGLASVNYADQLWRAAFAGPTAGVARPAAEKKEMLARAEEILRREMQAQFLATLPLAAQLDDGTDGNQNEYQLAKIDQARVSISDAQRLRDQIVGGEKPIQMALVSAWDPASIEQQISRVRDAYNAALVKYSGASTPGTVEYELQRSESAQTQNADREITLRGQYETELLAITGLDPSIYDGLRDDAQRQSYLDEVDRRFTTLINALDTGAAGLANGSQMSIQTLRLIQAVNQSFAAKSRVDSYAQKIRVELERNNEINATVIISDISYRAIELALGVAEAMPVIAITFHAQGLSSGTSTETKSNTNAVSGAILRASQQLLKTSETVVVNSVNSKAAIKNLLIEQAQAANEVTGINLNIDIAGAELRGLFNRAKRLVADHVFFQNVTNTLWYRDPSLAFKLEKAEEEYRDLLQDYRIESYKLARMLEASWIERFSNPVKVGNGSVVPLNNGTFDGFTEAESIFATANHQQIQLFCNALKTWDIRLREYRGQYVPDLWPANAFTDQALSLRRDIFKLQDYTYNINANRYEFNPALNTESIQKFRAVLLDLAARDPVNKDSLRRLRIDFPFTYNQVRIISGQPNVRAIVLQNKPSGGLDVFWNHRIKKVGIKIVGPRVFAVGNSAPVSLELYGNVDRIGYFVDSQVSPTTRTFSTFPTPLYQYDPDKRERVGSVAPFFGASSIKASINDNPEVITDVPGWPLFCDNFVLRIDGQGSLRIENITDIELNFQMETGSPPPINSSAW